MARAKMFKTDLARNTPLWHSPAQHEGYVQILTVYNPRSRTQGCYIPKQFEFMVPILLKMGFKVEHKPVRWAADTDTHWYAIGIIVQHTSRQQFERYTDRYAIPEMITSYITDNSNNKIFKMLLRRPVFTWETINYMKEPIPEETDENAGFGPDFVEVKW